MKVSMTAQLARDACTRGMRGSLVGGHTKLVHLQHRDGINYYKAGCDSTQCVCSCIWSLIFLYD